METLIKNKCDIGAIFVTSAIIIVLIGVIIFLSLDIQKLSHMTCPPITCPPIPDKKSLKSTISSNVQPYELSTHKGGINTVSYPPGLISANHTYKLGINDNGGISVTDNKNTVLFKTIATTPGTAPFIFDLDAEGHFCVLDKDLKHTWCANPARPVGDGPWTITLDNDGHLCYINDKKDVNWCSTKSENGKLCYIDQNKNTWCDN